VRRNVGHVPNPLEIGRGERVDGGASREQIRGDGLLVYRVSCTRTRRRGADGPSSRRMRATAVFAIRYPSPAAPERDGAPSRACVTVGTSPARRRDGAFALARAVGSAVVGATAAQSPLGLTSSVAHISRMSSGVDMCGERGVPSAHRDAFAKYAAEAIRMDVLLSQAMSFALKALRLVLVAGDSPL
jgi:hypothetical protein